MDDDGGGLFSIDVNSEDDAIVETEKVPRDFQSEEDFQRQRVEWKPKFEVGEVRMNSLLFKMCFRRLLGTNIEIP